MSFRPGSRIFSAFRPFFRQPLLKRNQSTAAPEESGFQKLWNSPVGPKTVHFWYVCHHFVFCETSSAHATALTPAPPISNTDTQQN